MFCYEDARYWVALFYWQQSLYPLFVLSRSKQVDKWTKLFRINLNIFKYGCLFK